MRPLVICVLSLLVGGVCFAQAQNSLHISQNNSDETLESYGRQDKYCLEWTDGCVNCVRGQAGSSSECSNKRLIRLKVKTLLKGAAVPMAIYTVSNGSPI